MRYPGNNFNQSSFGSFKLSPSDVIIESPDVLPMDLSEKKMK